MSKAVSHLKKSDRVMRGIVDYLLPMNYFREAGQQAAWFDTWTQWQVTYAGRRTMVLGLGSYLNSADGGIAQLGRARALGALVVSGGEAYLVGAAGTDEEADPRVERLRVQ